MISLELHTLALVGVVLNEVWLIPWSLVRGRVSRLFRR